MKSYLSGVHPGKCVTDQKGSLSIATDSEVTSKLLNKECHFGQPDGRVAPACSPQTGLGLIS